MRQSRSDCFASLAMTVLAPHIYKRNLRDTTLAPTHDFVEGIDAQAGQSKDEQCINDQM